MPMMTAILSVLMVHGTGVGVGVGVGALALESASASESGLSRVGVGVDHWRAIGHIKNGVGVGSSQIRRRSAGVGVTVR